MKRLHIALAGCIVALSISAKPTSAQTTDRLFVRLVVGEDDLRAGSSVWLYVRDRHGALLSGGARASTENVGWSTGTEHTVWVPLRRSVDPAEIGSLVIRHGQGMRRTDFGRQVWDSPDNWDLKRVDVMDRPGGQVLTVADNYIRIHRFTDSDRFFEVPVNGRRPNAPAETSELALRIRTGSDDLRGGGILEAFVFTQRGERLTDEAPLTLYGGQGWAEGSIHTIAVPLSRAVAVAEIGRVELRHTTVRGGTLGYDNWNVDRVEVLARPDGRVLREARGNPLHRFTHGNRVLQILGPPTQDEATLRQVTVRIRTGDDDLHEHSRVFGQVFDQAGRALSERRQLDRSSERWGDRTTHTEVLPLIQPTPRRDIRRLVLSFEPHSGGFSTGDNWNVDRVDLLVAPSGAEIISRSGRPFKRFTGDDRTLDLRF